ncbi:MAG: phage tail protein [Chitinophagaceae bacterium]|nr:phage tail protein [Chitinophagaceae bacterium]
MPNTQSSYYPPVGFYFRVSVTGINGQNEGNFQEVTGLNVKLDVEEIKEGGENRFAHRLPARPKYENLVLKRGMVADSFLITWARRATEQFIFTTKTVVLSLLNDDGVPLAAWNFVNAYPVAIKMSEFKAQENSIAIETLELCFDYFERTT